MVKSDTIEKEAQESNQQTTLYSWNMSELDPEHITEHA